MDFGRSRARLGGMASGGSHMVKTYGRFRQRMVNRDAKGTDDFARITGIKPILSEMMGSSSDSDFDSSNKAATPCQGPSEAVIDEKCTKDALQSVDMMSTTSGNTRKAATSKSRQPKPKIREKKTPTKGAAATSKTSNKEKPSSTVTDHTSERNIIRSQRSQEKPVVEPSAVAKDKAPAARPMRRAVSPDKSSSRASFDTANPKTTNSENKTSISPDQERATHAGTMDENILPTKSRHNSFSESSKEIPAQSPLSSGKVTRRRTNPRGRRPNGAARSHSIATEDQRQAPVSTSIHPYEPKGGTVDKNRVARTARDLSRRVSHIDIGDKLDVDMCELYTDSGDAAIIPDSESHSSETLVDTKPEPVSSGDCTAKPVANTKSTCNQEHVEGEIGDEDMLAEQEENRQVFATRTMRFKAPRNAWPQTCDSEDNDQEMLMEPMAKLANGSQQDEHMVIDPLELTTPKLEPTAQLDVCTQHETQEILFTQAPAANPFSYPISPPEETVDDMLTGKPKSFAPILAVQPPPTTPAKSKPSNTFNRDMPAGIHSPLRVVTPHRVVYSPPRPMTAVEPHFASIGNEITANAPLANKLDEFRWQKDNVSDSYAEFPALESTPSPHISNLRLSEKHRPSLPVAPQSRLSTSNMTDRRSTTSEVSNDPDIEETTVPFLPARRYVQKTHILAACGQTAPIDWAAGGLQACGVLLPDLDPSQYSEKQLGETESESGLCKIGEATYSEVFSAQWRYVPKTRYDKFNSKKGKVKGERIMQVALKIIPFGNTSVKSGTGEPQTTLRDLYQEIGATLALSRLSERERAKLQEARTQVKMPLKPKERELGANFVKAFRVCICKGPLPTPLLRAWDRWKTEYPDLCENVRPDYYPDNQLFAVFVLEMGGETLENAAISTWKEARSIIRQLALSMALAERNNRFEHRDLHWGNIMVTRYNSNLTFLYQLPPMGSRLKSTLISIPSYKVRCTIIDYTLSRLHIDNDTSEVVATTKPANYDSTNNVFYVALKDEALFQGEGDIQFDVYRQMRACAKNDWEEFHPHTNVLWLTYALHKILMTKSPSIKEELLAFAQSKIGSAFDSMPPEIKRAAGQELLRRWIHEFEQCESSSQVLKCAMLDLYKN